MRRVRTVTLVSALAFLLAMVAGVASAQEDETCVTTYPPGEQTCDVAVDDSSPEPGSTLVISATPFDPGTSAEGSVTSGGTAMGALAFDGAILAAPLAQAGTVIATDTATVDGSETATFEFEIPEDAPPGEATVTASGVFNGAPATYVTTVTIAGEGAGDDGSVGEEGLATTGGEFTVGAALAVIALLGGAALVVAARRRSGDPEVS